MPPMSCDRAVRGLMTRPAANTPSSRGTRTSPVSTFTRTSANCAPKEYSAYVVVLSFAGRPRRRSRRRRPGRSPNFSPERLGRRDDGRAPGCDARRAAGDRGARAARCRRSAARRASSRHAQRVGGDLRQRPSTRRCRCRRRRSRTTYRPGPRSGSSPSTGPAVHRVRRRRPPPMPTSQSPLAGAGLGSRSVPAEPLGALAQAARPGWRLDHGLARSPGRRRARCGCAARSGRCRRPRPARPSRPRGRTCPGTRRARASTSGTGTSSGASRWVVRRFGAAYIIRVGHGGLLGELLDPRRSARPRRCAMAASRPSRSAAEPDPLDGRACGSRRATNICWRVSASFTGRPGSACAAMAARTTLACGVPLEPNPPPTYGQITRTCSASRPKTVGDAPPHAVHALGGVPQRQRRRRPSHSGRCEACGSIGLLCSIGRGVASARR